jgi:hypothetical protein
MWHCVFGSIPHEIIHVHTQQTDCATDNRMKEHHHIWASQPWGGGDSPQPKDTSILSMKLIHMDRTIREATETESHPDNTNSEDALHPNKAWKPLIHSPGLLGWGLLPGCQGCVHFPSQWPTSATSHLLISPLEQIITLFRANTSHSSLCSYQPSLRSSQAIATSSPHSHLLFLCSSLNYIKA